MPETAEQQGRQRRRDARYEIRAPGALLEQLRVLAAEHERSLAGEIRVALAAWVRRSEDARP